MRSVCDQIGGSKTKGLFAENQTGLIHPNMRLKSYPNGCSSRKSVKIVYRCLILTIGGTSIKTLISVNLTGFIHLTEEIMSDDWDWPYNRDGKQKKQVDLINSSGGFNVTALMQGYDQKVLWEQNMGVPPENPAAKGARVSMTDMTCEGRWERQYISEGERVYNAVCKCYYLCVPCEGGTIWSGNVLGLPFTYGFMKHSGFGGVEGGDRCWCFTKPGPQTGCQGSKGRRSRRKRSGKS